MKNTFTSLCILLLTACSQALLAAIKAYSAEILYKYRSMNGVAIRLPNGTNLDDAIRHFEQVKGVLMVNKDQIMQLE